MPSDLIYREDAKDYARHASAKGLNVLEYLDDVPAADARPVVRGKWKEDWETGCSECSACGEGYLWEDYDGVGKWNFCPNCGARMENK